jgi:ribosomal protein L37AE/L43A
MTEKDKDKDHDEWNKEIVMCGFCHWTKQEDEAAKLNGVWICTDCMKRIVERHNTKNEDVEEKPRRRRVTLTEWNRNDEK